MATTSWTTVTPLVDGNPVNAATFNGPINELVARDEWLKAQIAKFGEPFASVVLSDLNIPTDVAAGDVVYVKTNGDVGKAIAAVDPTLEFNVYEGSATIGVLTAVKTVVIYGKLAMSLGQFKIQDVLEGEADEGQDPVPGIYYLSSTKAGYITRYPKGPKVLVGTFTSDAAYLTPSSKDMATSHVHRSYRLANTILSSGTDAEGWELVLSTDDDKEFAGWYRYDMGSEATILKNFWPPIPRSCCALVVQGVEQVQGDSPDEYIDYVITDKTIYVSFDPSTAGSIVLHYVRMVCGDTGPVTSLKPAKNSAITVKKCGTTQDATVGDLEIDLDFDAQDKEADTPGFKVYKKFEDGIFWRGPVVERIIGKLGITAHSGDPKYPGQGTVTLMLDDGCGGEFDTVALQNAKQEMLGLFPYIKIPAYNSAVPSGFISKFQVQPSSDDDDYNVKFYGAIFRLSGSGTCNLGFDFSVLPNLYGNNAATSIQNPTTVTKTIQVPSSTAYNPVLLTNDSKFDGQSDVLYVPTLFQNSGAETVVKSGYIVAVRFYAVGGGGNESATPDLGFINLRWGVLPASTASGA